MTATRRSPLRITASVILILAGIFRLILQRYDLHLKLYMYSFGYILLGIGLLIGIVYVGMIGAVLIAIPELQWTVNLFQVPDAYGTGWVITETIDNLGTIAALVLLILAMMPDKPGRPVKIPPLNGMLPGIVMVASAIPFTIFDHEWYFGGGGTPYFLLHLVEYAGIFIAGMAIAKEKQAASVSGYVPFSTPPHVAQARAVNVPHGQAVQPPNHFGQPVQPVQPGQYGQPVTPVQPVAPQAQPVQPVTPVQPVQPAPAQSAQPAQPAPRTMLSSEDMATLRQYKELADAGVISQEEFSAIKKKFLG